MNSLITVSKVPDMRADNHCWVQAQILNHGTFDEAGYSETQHP